MLLALPFVFYVSNSKQTRDHNLVDRGVVFVSAPIQWLVVAGLDGVSSLWHRYIALIGVQEENDRLKLENSELKAELVKREEQRIENARLSQLVALKERTEVRMLPAKVVAVSPTPLFRSVRISIGQDDGVTIGAAVVHQDGVVGRVAALAGSYADVMLLVDPNSSTDVLVQRTRARARVRGTGSDVHLGLATEYLARTADVEPGDVLITSGTGQSFPRGLVVGTVMAVERGAFGLYQETNVEPAVDFSRLELVMVIDQAFSRGTTFEQQQESSPGTVLGPVLDEVPQPGEAGAMR